MEVQQFEGFEGVKITADVDGDPAAQPIIFLHGGGQTRFSWGKAVREMAALGYYAVSIDLRGHGDSDWSPDGLYSLTRNCEDLKAILRTIDKPPVLIGASLGGVTSLVTLGENPEIKAKALVLVDVVARMIPSGIEHITNFMISGLDGFDSLEAAADAVATYLPHRPRPTDTSGLLKNLREGDDGRLYWHWDPRLMDPAKNTSDLAEMIVRKEAASAHIHIPTLLVRGMSSELVNDEGAAALLALIPHAKETIVSGARHMVAGDKNDAFNAAIEAFLGELD